MCIASNTKGKVITALVTLPFMAAMGKGLKDD